MEDMQYRNTARLRGCLAAAPQPWHESRGIAFDVFSLSAERLSGTIDTVQVKLRHALSASVALTPGEKIQVSGELRSFNNRSGVGPKLLISVYARELSVCDGPDENRIELTGALCKPPTFRVTPMGREICDLMLAVNRRYGRSDYLPCIVWGQRAHLVTHFPVGTTVHLCGRLQSRCYTKLLDGRAEEKIAYEVSVSEISRVS